jgi:protoporphyrinogen oxidase
VAEWLEDEEYPSIVRKLVDVENQGLFGATNRDLSFLFDVPKMSWNLCDPEEEDNESVYTFRKGMIEVIWALERELGNRIQKGADVNRVSISKEDDEIVEVSYQQWGRAQYARARAVILATPAPITASIVASGFSEKVMASLGSIHYAPYVTLNLFLSERVWRDAWSLACLDDSFVTIYDAIRTQVSEDYDERGILGVYIPGRNARDLSILDQSDDVLVEQTLRDLEKYASGIRNKLIGQDVHRMRYAFPIFRPGYLNVLRKLEEDDSTSGPLFLAGDYMVYPILDGAIKSGLRAAEKADDFL